MNRTPSTPIVRTDPLTKAIEQAITDQSLSPRLRRWLEKLASSGERAESTPRAEQVSMKTK